MIKARIQVMDEGIVYDEFDKEFVHEQEMWAWIRKQNEHPWLSVRIITGCSASGSANGL